jgi:glucose-6-phosphate isomerase
MGWVDLASNPPYPIDDIKAFAKQAKDAGLDQVLLLGEGGSTQAPMTITKYNSVDSSEVKFRTLDSDSPVRLRSLLDTCDPHKLIVITSSKSGGTIEPMSYLRAVRAELAKTLPEEEIVKHLVAITDPGSALEEQAKREGWLKVFSGEPTVGGRYSALSVFGLVPAALVGIDLDEFLEHARSAEAACSEDSVDNPAIILAAFLYDNYVQGRDKFSFLTQKRGRVLGLWIEQLIAESLGKNGKGILPNIEPDALGARQGPGRPHGDHVQDQERPLGRTQELRGQPGLRVRNHPAPVDDHRHGVQSGRRLRDVGIRHGHVRLPHGSLPLRPARRGFRQGRPPCRSSPKAKPEPDFVQGKIDGMVLGEVEVRLSDAMKGAATLEEALRKLMESVRPGDYFSLNAFLPFAGEGRREALELIRHTFASEFGMVSCLEVGPRYLHSTGQLQKGGPNNGVFLILSADELKDVPLPDWKVPSLAYAGQVAGLKATCASCPSAAVAWCTCTYPTTAAPPCARWATWCRRSPAPCSGSVRSSRARGKASRGRRPPHARPAPTHEGHARRPVLPAARFRLRRHFVQEALDIQVTGVVQGVGFRPFVYRLARTFLINGWVLNGVDGVHIHAEGEEKHIDEFVMALSEEGARRGPREEDHDGRSAPGRLHRFRDSAIPTTPQPTRRPSCRPIWPPATTASASSSTRPTAATAIPSSTAPTAAPASRSSAVCPTTALKRAWPISPCARRVRPNTSTRPTAASTPSPTPASTAART